MGGTPAALDESFESLPAESCSLVLQSGHVIHGRPDEISGNPPEVRLEVGDRLVFVPVDDIRNIGPLHIDLSASAPGALSERALGTALIQTSVSRASTLGYHTQQTGDVLSRARGFGSYEVAELEFSSTPSFPRDQLIYLDQEYVENWLEQNTGWGLKQFRNIQLGSPSWFPIQISYDLQDISDRDLAMYLGDSNAVQIGDVLDYDEPAVRGYLELIEQDGDYIRRTLAEDDHEWVAGVITATPDPRNIHPETAMIAWFKPDALWLEVSVIEPLDQIKLPIKMRGATWRWDIEIDDGTTDPVTLERNMKVRAGSISTTDESG